MVRMKVLRKAFESLGFAGVATFLGSGNLVFETRAKDIGKIEQKIERRLKQALGYSVRWSCMPRGSRSCRSSLRNIPGPKPVHSIAIELDLTVGQLLPYSRFQ